MPDDDAELGTLFARYGPQLLRMLERRIPPPLRPRIDPEDVLQQAFFRARRAYPEFKVRATRSAYPWLYTIALETLFKLVEHHNRVARTPQLALAWPDHSSTLFRMGLLDSATRPSGVLVEEEMRDRVREALRLLPAGDRDVLELHYREVLSFRRIGEVLGIGEDAARQRHHRALRKFKALWHGMNPPSEDGS